MNKNIAGSGCDPGANLIALDQRCGHGLYVLHSDPPGPFPQGLSVMRAA